jgi:hypothetical protein
MTNMLVMAAGKLRHPMIFVVFMVTGDWLLHIPSGKRASFPRPGGE